MNRLRLMAVYAAVVEAGSMTGAARALDLTPSAVSQQVRELERQLRVTLLRRSTRRLTLTEAGQAFYEGCAAMLAASRGAEQRLAELRDAAVGVLSLSVPVGFAAQHLTAALAPLLAAHRQLALRLVVTDDRLDLIESRIDLAIRIGPQPDSILVAHHLSDWEMVICASPAYLARRGVPRSPEDLEGHDWLLQARRRHDMEEVVDREGNRRRIRMQSRVTSNNQLSLKQLALAGLGLSFQVLPEVASELDDTRLVRVLPAWSLSPIGVFAVTPPGHRMPPKVRYAIEALRAYLATKPYPTNL